MCRIFTDYSFTEHALRGLSASDVLPLTFSRIKTYLARLSLDYLQTDDKLLRTIEFMDHEACTLKGFSDKRIDAACPLKLNAI